MKSGLPIDEALEPLARALRDSPSAVLQAPPGAGKSTVVPLALLQEDWTGPRRLLMLEPRRLAARAVASRMAQTLGESVGQTVGYRMRMDTRVSKSTRIEVITEGILTRMLQSDPALEGVAGVIFDEFHERSLQADLGLALALDARENLSPDLRILVMSATLETEGVARLLGEAPVVSSQGRAYPVEVRFAGRGAPLLPGTSAQDSPERVTAQLVLRALREEPGDVLVFLPGAREIRRVQAFLGSAGLGAVQVRPLYGELGGEEQDLALAPDPRGLRKVVLATNIAETSLTIEGVRVVVDSGLVRRAVFDPSTGMSVLATQRISRASAQQRQGRAGRLSPGVCYRAWSEEAHRSLAPFSAPEILDADLAPLALELAGWGAREAGSMRWLDAPPAAQLASARDLLERLGALDGERRITAHGRAMQRIGTHPRLAHMLLSAQSLGSVSAAAELAALLSERDLLRGLPGSRDADIRTRLGLLSGEAVPEGVDRGALARVRRSARELAREAGNASPVAGRQALDAGELLALAYPDRIGRRRGGTEPRFTLANGRGAVFTDAQGLARSELIVAVDLDDRERDARILLAAPLTREGLQAHFGALIRTTASVEWVSREQAVLARRVVQLGSLVLEESPLPQIPVEAARTAMLTGIREMGIASLPWDEESRVLQARVELVRGLDSKEPWPDLSDERLAATLEGWLSAWLEGVTRREHLARLPLPDILRAQLSFEQQRRLDTLAPTHLTVPSGSRVRIDYTAGGGPAVAVRLQEVFGMTETPRIVQGRVPLLFHLLSPARRPVQVTADLASFWRGAYAEVRKDLRGRYPRHHWPENPLEATATRGPRPRK